MERVIQISPEQEDKLREYAEAQRQTPDEVIQQIVTDALARLLQHEATSSVPDVSQSAFADPWAGFRGRYDIPIPDLVERHDYYIGEDALKTHEEKSNDT